MNNKIITILILILFSSCSAWKERSVSLDKQKLSFVDRSIIETTKPGDRVYITIPANNPERPKGVTETYQGSKGAVAEVDFDNDGVVTGFRVDCPEEHILEQRNIELENQIKIKEIENKTNIEAINAIGKWTAITLIPIGLFFALAFYFKN